MLSQSIMKPCSGGQSCAGGSFGTAALLPGCELLGNQQRDVDVAFSIFKCQFFRRGILDKAFVELVQGVEEKEEKASLLAVKQPGPCQVALLGWWQCGTQHWLIPTGNGKPFKASRLLSRPSPRAGLSPSPATGWQHRAPAS